MQVGYLGIKGSNSEAVASAAYGENLQGYSTIPAMFHALIAEKTDRCVVPIENSVEGSVGITNDLLYREEVRIVAEHYRKITHSLIAFPGTRIEDIEAVISHPQATGQCSTFIENHGFRVIPFPDTATSVASLSDKNYRNFAAIGDARAARIYGMEVLSENIGDYSENFTRFVSLEKGSWMVPENRNNLKLSVVAASSDRPGSLMRILNAYSTLGINLTKIESRPLKFEPWNYIFFLDSESGNSLPDLMEALRSATNDFKILGVYPRALARL